MMEERVAEVAAQATEVFGGSAAAALRWLKMPERALGGRVPVCLLATDYGFLQVCNLLTDLGRVSRLAA
jgi:putative toxin-antitoxin system antitoxin component (TIGR02293 family)